jgi:hypothetical protein
VCDAAGRRERVCFIAPRGSAKSTWLTLVYVLREALEGREAYILVISETDEQAKQDLQTIREELETNASLHLAYPVACQPGGPWNKHELTLGNGVKIKAIGTGGAMRGSKRGDKRPTLVIVDDPQSLRSVLSEKDRERKWRWLNRDLLPAMDKVGNVFVVGTPVHPESIVWKLTSAAGWRTKTYRSIITYPKNMGKWDEWATEYMRQFHDEECEAKARQFFEQNKEAMEEGAVVLWPEWRPLYDLMRDRETLGPEAFDAEEQCEPSDPKVIEWPSHYFDWEDMWFNEFPSTGIQVKCCYLDPSMGKKSKKGDWSCFILYADDGPHGNIWVEAMMIRAPAVTLAEYGMDIIARFHPDGFGIEANAFQALLGSFFRNAATERKAQFNYYADQNTVPKEVRIRRLTEPLSRKRIRFRRTNGTLELVNQLRQFPTARYDDGPDALEGAWRLATMLRKGKR